MKALILETMEDVILEEGIVEEDGIKYETPIIFV